VLSVRLLTISDDVETTIQRIMLSVPAPEYK